MILFLFTTLSIIIDYFAIETHADVEILEIRTLVPTYVSFKYNIVKFVGFRSKYEILMT